MDLFLAVSRGFHFLCSIPLFSLGDTDPSSPPHCELLALPLSLSHASFHHLYTLNTFWLPLEEEQFLFFPR